ncbi:MAG TPA: hypothetical protein VLO11_09930 [Luteolibacter sp.]|nr:hypothetical protein [Luteolibacter sp.]
MGRWMSALAILLALAGLGWWALREPLARHRPEDGGAVTKPRPDAKTYAVLVSELERWRRELAERHRLARGPEERTAVEHDARLLLERVLPEMMRCWLGTPWDFNGIAEKPGEEGIACGYFVATLLKDAGFRLDRYRLAKQPSENILRSFLPRESCVLRVGEDFTKYADRLDAAEPGIHLVGLDTHVGFIVTGTDGGFRFIHSSGSDPWCVVDDDREAAVVLQRSRWRMLGNLTADPQVIRRWVRGERIAVRDT